MARSEAPQQQKEQKQKEAFDVEAAIEEFLEDDASETLELPHMTTGQRKTARKTAEAKGLTCESYGFGADRKLMLLKRSKVAATKPELPSSQEPATKKSKQPAKESASEKDTSLSAGDRQPQQCQREQRISSSSSSSGDSSSFPATSAASAKARQPSNSSCSTSASDVASGSTVLDKDGAQPLIPHSHLQVRNTFIHIQAASSDERVIQSMPHGMFGRRLLEEAAAQAAGKAREPEEAPEEPEEDLDQDAGTPPSCPSDSESQAPTPTVVVPLEPAVLRTMIAPPPDKVAPGTLVILQSLSKCPAFNGCYAYVQCFETDSGRYSVIVTGADGRQQWAKVKGENLRPVPMPQDTVRSCGVHQHMQGYPGAPSIVPQFPRAVAA